MLRTAYIHNLGKHLLQLVLKDKNTKFDFQDLTEERSISDVNDYIMKYKKDDRNNPLNLSNDPLAYITIFKKSEKNYEIIWSFHHILMDGWCISIILADFLALYHNKINNQYIELEKPVPFKEYLRWYIKQDAEAAVKYWRNYLSDVVYPTSIFPNNAINSNSGLYKSGQYYYNLDLELSNSMRNLAKVQNITLFSVIKTIWGVLLSKLNARSKVVFGSVVSGRSPEIKDVEKIIGLCMNTIPIKINYEDDDISSVLSEVHRDSIESEPFHYYSLSKIQSLSVLKNKLVDHVLVFENYPTDKRLKRILQEENNPHTFEVLDINYYTHGIYNFGLVIYPEDQIILRFEYNSEVISQEYILDIIKYFEEISKQVIMDPGRLIHEITLQNNYQILETTIGADGGDFGF